LFNYYNDTKIFQSCKAKSSREFLIVARVWAGGTRATLFLLAAHFAKRNTKFGGGGKIGIGKRGRAKIPSPPTPFLFARPSVQFLPREARQSVGVSFKKGSSFVQ